MPTPMRKVSQQNSDSDSDDPDYQPLNSDNETVRTAVLKRAQSLGSPCNNVQDGDNHNGGMNDGRRFATSAPLPVGFNPVEKQVSIPLQRPPKRLRLSTESTERPSKSVRFFFCPFST